MEKKKKISSVIIILIVLLLGSFGYIGYSEIFKADTEKECIKEDTTKTESNLSINLTSSEALNLVKEKYLNLKEYFSVDESDSTFYEFDIDGMEDLVYGSLINYITSDNDGEHYIITAEQYNNIKLNSSIYSTENLKVDYEVLSYNDDIIVAKISLLESGVTLITTHIFVLMNDSNNWKIAAF